MSNFEAHEVYTDTDSNLYFRFDGLETRVTGTSVPYDKSKELRKAYADDNNKLCVKMHGRFVEMDQVTECPKHPAPRPLAASEDGTLYVYHDGAYTLITLS
jgi:hypothetical protein